MAILPDDVVSAEVCIGIKLSAVFITTGYNAAEKIRNKLQMKINQDPVFDCAESFGKYAGYSLIHFFSNF